MHSLPARPSEFPIRTIASRNRNLITIFKKRQKVAVIIFLSVFLIAASIALIMPKTYSGSTEFLVSNDRVNNPIDPEKNTQAIVYLDEISEARINTEVSLLTSNDILIELVRRCKLTSLIKGRLSEQQREEMALEILKRDLVVASLKRSAIIRVTYKSHSPQTTVEVLRTLSSLYLESHLRLSGSPESYAFFQNLWKGATEERAKAEEELASFKTEHGIVSLPEEKAIALQNEAELEKQLSTVDALAGRSARQGSALLGLIAKTPETIVSERKALPNQSQEEQLGILLTALQNKRIEAASRYQPNDRSLQDLNAQIAQVKKDITSATEHSAQEVSTVLNPAVNAARTDTLRAQSEAAGYGAQSAVIRNKMWTTRYKLAALDKETPAYNLLSENVARLTDLDHEYHQKVDAAQVTKMLDQDHISNVAVAEQPYASTRPTSPRLGMMLGFGFSWACIIAFTVVFLLDRFSTRVTSIAEVERYLDAPVLALVRSVDHPLPLVSRLTDLSPSLSRKTSGEFWRTA